MSRTIDELIEELQAERRAKVNARAEQLASEMKAHIEVGDKVRVPSWMAVHGRYNRGVVTHKDGANLLVKLNFKGVVCHLYTNEVTHGWR